MARYTINTKAETPADLARAFRSAAAKLDAQDLTPGADVRVGNLRIQVAEKQESTIRAWAREHATELAEQGIVVGGRGRYSQALLEAYAAHQKAERSAKRKAARERKLAEAEAVAA